MLKANINWTPNKQRDFFCLTLWEVLQGSLGSDIHVTWRFVHPSSCELFFICNFTYFLCGCAVPCVAMETIHAAFENCNVLDSNNRRPCSCHSMQGWCFQQDHSGLTVDGFKYTITLLIIALYFNCNTWIAKVMLTYSDKTQSGLAGIKMVAVLRCLFKKK